MWKKYFKVINIVPGRVLIHGHGIVDFSRDDLPLEFVKNLYEDDCRYLDITSEGKEVIYNIKPATSKKTVKKEETYSIDVPDISEHNDDEIKSTSPKIRKKRNRKKPVD
jgi:hypothetical protein